ncbi:GNAT family N-acetyltransferase [Rheinheimera baltica]|uniref:GNAT family N-acetyltransferase n=1 Tax=Rheinheimera baltica TaxID=67576 RepID=A0ABT9I264_9GAMM|nr:GNAT family N-acetyltransferase [Rheinheimera baltica]MDP5137466.1 GNAT family N-acetyltransferase [Rheinheimera baltica]MDP5141500.1 GNAT family N-acetyltransferase [Rheinheimera baltica]MDP5148736.1 GNAT family N-acetyltransferase [Rheinheimera baltica]MDP5190982.1 GNAT family N-acetyltransferase [Rheinheimera baltica]
MKIVQDDLASGEVIALLHEHLADMYATSPPESVHALDVDALKASNIRFFSAWLDGELAGCVAIKALDSQLAELKSMRTTKAFRGKGIGQALLQFVIEHAKAQGFTAVNLETGTQDYFAPARNLYRKFGFTDCGPFGQYKLDPNSHFMSLALC